MLLPQLPITATIRNLRNMAKCNFLVPFSDASRVVAERISNQEIIHKGRVHPVQFLNALLNYPVGMPRQLENAWPPIEGDKWPVAPNVVQALNDGFQNSFKTIKPSGKNTLLALDVSGSMGWVWCLGMQGVTPREASAALCLITANVEQNHIIGIFQEKFEIFNKIYAGMHITDAIKVISGLQFGRTNVSSPVTWAIDNKVPIDTISCYTDNETYCGTIHPSQALVELQNKMSRNTKFISVSMCANNTTVADPDNKSMLDIIGFDTATPKVISEFSDM
jgi:60 kDa SS-A/Ro ribonucleoprotein